MLRRLRRAIAPAVLALLLFTPAVAQKAGKGTPAQTPHAERPDLVPQWEVAAKGAFKTVRATDSVVKKALKAKDLAGAQKLLGKEGAFEGTVTKVYTPKKNTIVILNFAPSFRDALTAVVKPESYENFPDLRTLEKKRVLVSGKLEVYQGRPQIVLTKPEQVRIVQP